MTRVLVDTHAFLWFVFDDPRLSNAAAEVLSDQGVRKLISIASLWEITVKVQLGKLGLGMSLEAFLAELVVGRELDVVPIELEHLLVYGELPLLHRDPFDRLLVAQSKALDVPVLTADPSFAQYGVKVSW